MQDSFARQSTRHAHGRIDKLEHALERALAGRLRSQLFAGRCYLCGLPVRRGSRYCYAHDWAAGKS